jgi:hypothetical protein
MVIPVALGLLTGPANGVTWPPRRGEVWRLYFTDRVAREAAIYCPECAEREFGLAERT